MVLLNVRHKTRRWLGEVFWHDIMSEGSGTKFRKERVGGLDFNRLLRTCAKCPLRRVADNGRKVSPIRRKVSSSMDTSSFFALNGRSDGLSASEAQAQPFSGKSDSRMG